MEIGNLARQIHERLNGATHGTIGKFINVFESVIVNYSHDISKAFRTFQRVFRAALRRGEDWAIEATYFVPLEMGL